MARKLLIYSFVILITLSFVTVNECLAGTPELQNLGNKIYKENVSAVCDLETTIELDKMETAENGVLKRAKMTFSGTGFFVEGERDNILYTNAHMVRVANDEIVLNAFMSMLFGIPPEVVKITKYDNKIILNGIVYKGEVISFSHDLDMAIVRCVGIRRSEHGAVKIGNSDTVKVGDLIWAIGNSYGEFSQSFSSGMVSKIHRVVGFGYLEDFIQTMAPLYPGNSGSPIFNCEGEVIAILKGGCSDNLNFVVPINLFKTLNGAKGQKEVPCLGVEAELKNFPRSSINLGNNTILVSKEDMETIERMTGIKDRKDLVALARASYKRGAIVVFDYSRNNFGTLQIISYLINPDGLKKGDLILKIDGKEVKNGADIRMILLLSGKKAGDTVEVEYERVSNGKMMNKTVKIILTDHPQTSE